MTKQESINKWLERPIQIGDIIDVKIIYLKDEHITEGKGKNKVINTITKECVKCDIGSVIDIINDDILGIIYITKFSSWSLPSEEQKIINHLVINKNYEYSVTLVRAKFATPDISHCGSNSFKKQPVRINFLSQNINALLNNAGYGKSNNSFNTMEIKTILQSNHESEKHVIGKTYGGINFNPYVTDSQGNKQYYQRDLVWTLEQKQALIDSIYNWVEIGKFVFRYKSWSQLEKEMIEFGHGYNFECIDGKQRMNTIIDFVQNKFKDSDGNYWSDLSIAAHREFLNYDRLIFGKLDEGTTDNMVIDTFLNLNFTGVPMSLEHIKYVQSINL